MITFVLAFFLAIASHAQAADVPLLVIDSEVSFNVAHNPRIMGLSEVLLELEYFDEPKPLVFLYDLNGDNVDEIFIRSNQSLCGNGGCDYVLIDGQSNKRIGDLFGNPVVVLQKKKGQSFPDIQAFAHSGSGTGTLDTYRYKSGKYKSASSVGLSGRRVDKYFEKIGKTPVAGVSPAVIRGNVTE